MSSEPDPSINLSLGSLLAERALSLADVETVRLILRGNSVVDWNRLHFRDTDEVDAFFRLHLLDPKDPVDLARLRHLFDDAIVYLQDQLGLHFPDDLRAPADIRQIFLYASQTGGFRRHQVLACVILKLMHVINHTEAAELRFYTPLSEAELMILAERSISATLARMQAEGFPLVSVSGSRKERHSIITKLLAKRDTTAATIFDKLRFRLVTEKPGQLLGCIAWLAHNLFPLNNVIPGQSHNNLLRLDQILSAPPYDHLVDQLQGWSLEEDAFNPEDNPFSGASYRMVNFIVDFPVRVDHAVDPRTVARFGRAAFVLVEFQIMDAATAKANDEGENAHELYKERQRAIVAARLRKGARWKRRATPARNGKKNGGGGPVAG